MILFQFFKHFFRLGGVLITTSNRKPDEFHLPNDLRCRQFQKFLLQHLEFFSLEKGPDYRLKEFETSGVKFFQRSAYKGSQECAYSFQALFESPVGVAYYNSILQKCESIIITDFKQLNDENENSLTRFMLLIDLLYERKIRLFMDVAFDLKDIYIGKKYTQSFQRTLSRLFEIINR